MTNSSRFDRSGHAVAAARPPVPPPRTIRRGACCGARPAGARTARAPRPSRRSGSRLDRTGSLRRSWPASPACRDGRLPGAAPRSRRTARPRRAGWRGTSCAPGARRRVARPARQAARPARRSASLPSPQNIRRVRRPPRGTRLQVDRQFPRRGHTSRECGAARSFPLARLRHLHVRRYRRIRVPCPLPELTKRRLDRRDHRDGVGENRNPPEGDAKQRAEEISAALEDETELQPGA